MSMTVIEHIEVGSGGAANIEFTAIPQTYTDLYLVVSARCEADPSGVNQNIGVVFNGSAANRTNRELYGTGSVAGSSSLTVLRLGYASSQYATSNTFGNAHGYIPNYTSSNAKSISGDGVAEGNTTGMFMAIEAGLWNDTAAITSITVVAADGAKDFLQYSSATLYGITAGSDGTTTVS